MAHSTPIAHVVGRRKSAVARVWLRKGSGVITVNNKPLDEYFDSAAAQKTARKPFSVLTSSISYDIDANIVGGGKIGQADALKLGIARALVKTNEDLRNILRDHDLLTVDSRVKERKKPGQRGARRKFQFVKR